MTNAVLQDMNAVSHDTTSVILRDALHTAKIFLLHIILHTLNVPELILATLYQFLLQTAINWESAKCKPTTLPIATNTLENFQPLQQ